MCAGHFMMSFEALFYLALATIALGNGCSSRACRARSTTSTSRRSRRAGLQRYMSSSTRRLSRPLISGPRRALRWHYGFGAAGIGMLAGLLIYLSGQRYLPPEPTKRCSGHRVSKVRLGRDTILTPLHCMSVTVFRGAYEQSATPLPFGPMPGVDRSAGHSSFDDLVHSLNPLFVIMMTPPCSHIGAARREGHDPARAAKALGALIVAAAYLMCWPAWLSGSSSARGPGGSRSLSSSLWAGCSSCQRAWTVRPTGATGMGANDRCRLVLALQRKSRGRPGRDPVGRHEHAAFFALWPDFRGRRAPASVARPRSFVVSIKSGSNRPNLFDFLMGQ